MKKLVLVLVVLLGLIVAGLPWFNGMMAQRAAVEAVAAANERNAALGSDVRIEILSYDRGYGQSRAEWRIDLGSLSQVVGIREVVFTETASHGMLGITTETRLDKNPWFKDAVASVSGGQGTWFSDWAASPLAITTRYPVFGPISCRITLDPFDVTDVAVPLAVGHLDLTVDVDKDLNRVRSRGRWEGLTRDAQNSLGPVDFESDQEKAGEMIWTGSVKVMLGAFKAGAGQEAVAADNLTALFRLDARAGDPDMALGMDLFWDRVKAQGRSLSDGVLQWEINHVDFKVYQELVRLYSQLLRETVAGQSGLASPGRPGAMAGALAASQSQLMAGLEKLLKKDLEIRIHQVKVGLPEGEVLGRFALGLKKDMTLAGFLPLLGDPASALEIFSLESELAMPANLGGAELTRPLMPGMAAGLFVKDGERLVHRAETRDNALFLNGQKVNLNL